MDRRKIFEQQRRLRQQRSRGAPLREAADPDEVSALLDEPVDEVRLRRPTALLLSGGAEPPSRSEQELLEELEAAFEQERWDGLLEETGRDILFSIAGPFGLGKWLSAYDKQGGSVDTIHNVRQGTYATEQEAGAYEARSEYDSHTVHRDAAYTESNRRLAEERRSGGARDAYSGKPLTERDKVDQDHVISAKLTHDDRGRVLAGLTTQELANIDANLVGTDRSINRSKQARSPEEFAQYLEDGSEKRRARIKALGAKESLTVKQEKELNKLQKLDSVDIEALKAEGAAAQAAQDRKLNRAYYTSDKFLGSLTRTSVREGAKMGLQQAVGVIVVELFAGIIRETRSLFRSGVVGDSLFSDLKARLRGVLGDVLARWQDVLKGFGGGFVSGMLSNIVTTIINAFATTGARLVRMIREGVFSLLRALKMAIHPPEDMTPRQASHEAMKLMTAGGLVVAGVAVEESFSSMFLAIPLLAPMAPVLTAVIVGSLSALSIAFVAYLLDKVDLFGAMKQQRDDHVVGLLDQGIQDGAARCEALLDQLEAAALAS